MAVLRVAPETLIGRMLPGIDAILEAVGFDRHGDLLLTLSGADVPETFGEIVATIHTKTVEGRPRIEERIELNTRVNIRKTGFIVGDPQEPPDVP